MSDFWPSIEDQLADLNRQATATLDRDDRDPEPPGLPAPGTWIRATRLDDDAQALPATPWHYVVGWNARFGCLSTRCNWRPTGRALNLALDRYVDRYVDRYLVPLTPGEWQRSALEVEPERPPAGVCEQCVIALERDAKREVRRETPRHWRRSPWPPGRSRRMTPSTMRNEAGGCERPAYDQRMISAAAT